MVPLGCCFLQPIEAGRDCPPTSGVTVVALSRGNRFLNPEVNMVGNFQLLGSTNREAARFSQRKSMTIEHNGTILEDFEQTPIQYVPSVGASLSSILSKLVADAAQALDQDHAVAR